MSARPRPETLPPEELDLLLSRHLDGDLSPDETAELERFLAASPEARNRLEALSAVVASLHAAPAPAASFALSTRIFAGVLEGSGAVSGLFHRFGIAPKYGYLFALMAAISLVAVGLLSKTAPPVQVAQAPSRDVVSVFIPSSPAPAGKSADKAGRTAGAPAAPSAPAALQVASAESAQSAANEASPASNRASESPARTGAAPAEGAPAPQSIVADGTVGAAGVLGRRDAPSESRADARGELKSEAAALSSSKAKPSSATSPEATREAVAADFAPETAAKGAPAPAAAAGGPAAAPRMAAAGAAAPAPAPASASPSIALVSPAGGPAAWKLAVVPGLATLRGPLTARYRLAVSSDGRVTVAKKLTATPDPLPPAAEALILGLRLERIAGIPESSEIEIRLTIP